MGLFDDDEDTATTEPGLFESIGAAAGAAVDSAVDTVVDTVVETAEETYDAAAGAVDTVTETAEEVYDDPAGAAKGAVSYAADEARGAVDSAEQLADDAIDFTANAASTADTVVSTIADDAYDAASAAGTAIEEGAEAAYDSTVQGVEEAYDSAAQTAQEIYDDPSGAAKSAVGFVADEARAGVDAVENKIDAGIDRLENDPMGAITYATTKINPFTPTVDIDSDASDGTVGTHYSYYGVTGDQTATTDAAGNTTYHAGLGTDLPESFEGPKMSADLTLDKDNDFKNFETEGNVTVPIEGVDLGLDWKGDVAQADDGRLSASGEYTVTGTVDGLTAGGGQHFKATENEDGGFDARVGVHQVAGAGVAIPGTDEIPSTLGVPNLVDGKVRYDEDVDLSVSGSGQVTAGVHGSETKTISVLGEDVAETKLEAGVHYTTGPDGERVIVDGGVSGHVGTEDLGTAGAGTNVRYELGSDAQGNDVDRVTVTDTASVVDSDGNTITSATNTKVIDDATGLDPAIVTGDDGAAEPQYSMGVDIEPEHGMGVDLPSDPVLIEDPVANDPAIDTPVEPIDLPTDVIDPPVDVIEDPVANDPAIDTPVEPIEMPTVELGDLGGEELVSAAGSALEESFESFDQSFSEDVVE